MSEMITISGVRGFINEDGIAMLNLEDVARGLGFTSAETKGGKEYISIRWRRINGYLSEFSFLPLVAEENKPEFIPENIFYRLAMKARNETAEKFQAKVADEILPSIRKHGAYLTPKKIEEVLLNPDTIIQLAQTLKIEQEKVKQLSQQVEDDRPKVTFANSVEVSKSSILIGDLAKLIKQNGCDVGQKRLFEWMRENNYLIKSGESKNMPTQRAMEMKLFEVKESTVNNPDGSIRITKTTKVTGKGQIYFINIFLQSRMGKGA